MEGKRRGLVVVVILAIAVRVLFVLGADPDRVATRWSNVGDASLYDRFGRNLAEEGVLGVGDRPSAFVMPGYPLFVGAVYAVAGHRPGAVRWAQVALGVLAILALGRTARLWGGPRAEVFAVAAGAVYPYFVYFVPEIITETLFLAALSGALFFAARLGGSGLVRDGLLHGVCLAVAFLTRPVALLLEPGLLLLARPWAAPDRGRKILGLFLGFAVLLAGWGAWIARNHAVFGELVPVDTHGGFTFYTSLLASRGLDHREVVASARRELGYYRDDVERGTLGAGPRAEIEADARAAARAREILEEDPGAVVAAIPKNVADLWLPSGFGKLDRRLGGYGVVTLAGWASYLAVLLFALAGLVRAWRSGRPEVALGALWIFGITTLFFAFMGGAGKRYRAGTVDPLLLVLASWEAGERLRRRRP